MTWLSSSGQRMWLTLALTLASTVSASLAFRNVSVVSLTLARLYPFCRLIVRCLCAQVRGFLLAAWLTEETPDRKATLEEAMRLIADGTIKLEAGVQAPRAGPCDALQCEDLHWNTEGCSLAGSGNREGDECIGGSKGQCLEPELVMLCMHSDQCESLAEPALHVLQRLGAPTSRISTL